MTDPKLTQEEREKARALTALARAYDNDDDWRRRAKAAEARVERWQRQAEAAEAAIKGWKARVAELEKGIPLKEIENASHAELVRLAGAEGSYRKQIEARLHQATEAAKRATEQLDCAEAEVWKHAVIADRTAGEWLQRHFDTARSALATLEEKDD